MKATGNLIYPLRLDKGDRIGVIAPAGPFDQAKFSRGLKVLEALGFQVHAGKDLSTGTGYLAGSDQHRVRHLLEAFEDPEIKAVMCARGGYGSMRILDLIDFQALRTKPKIFIGFSDVSALLTVLYARSGMATFHGPVVTTFGTIDQFSLDAFLRAVSSPEPVVLRANRKGSIIQPGKVSGPVLAGNLATFCHLTGTPYQPDYDGHILLLEDIAEPPYKIDRMLTQLKLAGCLKNLAGLGLGVFSNCGGQEELEDIVKDIFTGTRIPMLSGFEFGHGRRNVTVPIGGTATLDTELKQLKFHRPATRE